MVNNKDVSERKIQNSEEKAMPYEIKEKEKKMKNDEERGEKVKKEVEGGEKGA